MVFAKQAFFETSGFSVRFLRPPGEGGLIEYATTPVALCSPPVRRTHQPRHHRTPASWRTNPAIVKTPAIPSTDGGTKAQGAAPLVLNRSMANGWKLGAGVGAPSPAECAPDGTYVLEPPRDGVGVPEDVVELQPQST